MEGNNSPDALERSESTSCDSHEIARAAHKSIRKTKASSSTHHWTDDVESSSENDSAREEEDVLVATVASYMKRETRRDIGMAINDISKPPHVDERLMVT